MTELSVNRVDLRLGDSETARLISARDWSATPLGAVAQWPLSLKSAAAMMVRSTMSMVILWGTDGILLYNDAYAEIAGARHPELLGMAVRKAWPEIAEFHGHALNAVLAGGSLAYRDQPLAIMRDGEPQRIWVNLDYSPLLDDDGKPAGVMTIVTETTGRVLAERQLAAQHERMRAMFDQAPGFIAMMEGPEHRFVLVNQAYTRLMGPREVVDRTVREAVPEAVGQGLIHHLDSAYRTGEPFVGHAYKFTIPDLKGRISDHYLDFVYQPVRDEAGAVCGIFAQGSDVTERVLAERALRKSEEEYRNLNDALLRANEIMAASADLHGV